MLWGEGVSDDNSSSSTSASTSYELPRKRSRRNKDDASDFQRRLFKQYKSYEMPNYSFQFSPVKKKKLTAKFLVGRCYGCPLGYVNGSINFKKAFVVAISPGISLFSAVATMLYIEKNVNGVTIAEFLIQKVFNEIIENGSYYAKYLQKFHIDEDTEQIYSRINTTLNGLAEKKSKGHIVFQVLADITCRLIRLFANEADAAETAQISFLPRRNQSGQSIDLIWFDHIVFPLKLAGKYILTDFPPSATCKKGKRILDRYYKRSGNTFEIN